ncbi:hypothetical protein DXG03_002655 [Asterophora parasitica]|uniref:t-SNARE coiled-coil homology domain-containing protein n=1 Tax=Asterophora parasitica TaxID=117018 RepID=A0A9P7KFA7_9AGAR|nr:hypothetical protein DXG03_002655 [Asterophora parasitica]
MSTKDRLAAARARRQADAQAHEMDDMSTPAPAPTQGPTGTGPSSDFFSEEGQTQDLEKLDRLADETRELSNGLKDRIKALAGTVGPDAQMRTNQLSSSTRYGESRMAFREAQERQEELKKMERTLAELAQLFADVGALTEAQQDPINTIEVDASKVQQDTEKA